MSSEIEKKSLEAHVELSAERHSRFEERVENLSDQMNNKLDDLDDRMEFAEEAIKQNEEQIRQINDDHTKQMLKWAIAIISFLAASIATLVIRYLTSAPVINQHLGK